jgi:hypothetical protein
LPGDVVFLQRFSDDDFRYSVGVAIGLDNVKLALLLNINIMSMETYCVPRVDAPLVGMVDERKRFFFVHHPTRPFRGAEAHTSENDLGDFQARVAQSLKFHHVSTLPQTLNSLDSSKRICNTHRAYSIFGRVVMIGL